MRIFCFLWFFAHGHASVSAFPFIVFVSADCHQFAHLTVFRHIPIDGPLPFISEDILYQVHQQINACKTIVIPSHRTHPNKKAHPEGCAKKVLSPVAATQTIRYLHREMRETPFYQGMFPLANSNYSVCVASSFYHRNPQK